ncbi:hypothetical protein [Calothrix sp. CCY 0018]|uniref:hypothetical protein n=1 Tax=Calothrix sp. CCY 0018 TaxID=3103864 RepID=UPI0039C71A67
MSRTLRVEKAIAHLESIVRVPSQKVHPSQLNNFYQKKVLPVDQNQLKIEC